MDMDNALQWLKWALVAAGTGISTLLGGWDMALKVLVLFVVCDYVTGMVAAWHEKSLDSNVGFFGIAKKVLLFVPVALGYWLDQALGSEILRNLAIFFYIANEGLSILENLGRVGIAVPPTLLEALQQLKDKSSKKEG
jgi:toxin secretion/phage lysis holin